MYSPIEQFKVYPVVQLSNVSFYLILIIILIYLFSKNESLFSYHIGWWYKNLINLEYYLFIFLTLWFLVLFANIIGMIPYSNTITAQIFLVFSLSLPTFIGINIIGITRHKGNLFYLILPAGAPIGLIPLIAILELISYLIRTLSLTIRLAANMIAGHVLIKILIYSLLGSLPLFSIILLPILLLELVVAFLQGYVFLTLVISYFQDILVPH